MDWAQAEGKATAVITTNGITDASPAGAYAKVAYRWNEPITSQHGL